jgi:Family of unknown function (DUF5758)/Pentapeptide repeats (8 copies)
MDLRNVYGNIIFSAAVLTIKDLVLAAIKSNVSLCGANLYGADLQSADLQGANLHGADLRGADLYGADLRGADLRDADLRGADLQSADLQSANLRGANLHGADLQSAENVSDLAAAESNILPEGVIIGWKKCQHEVIVKLIIPAKARRSNATGRKCRAEFVRVAAVFGAEEGISIYYPSVRYRKGETVTCDHWNEDRWVECGGGIHFYLSRIEAENN